MAWDIEVSDAPVSLSNKEFSRFLCGTAIIHQDTERIRLVDLSVDRNQRYTQGSAGKDITGLADGLGGHGNNSLDLACGEGSQMLLGVFFTMNSA